LAIPDDEELIEELVNVRLRETSPNVYRLDHDPDRHDDRAATIGMALVELTTAGPMARPFLYNDEELAYERTLAASGQPRSQLLPGWHMAGSFALDEAALIESDPGDIGRTKPSPFV
jgi:hypothetical protein